MIVLKNILVATDFGEASDAALTYGRELARTFGGTLHVLHVVENLFTTVYGAEGYVYQAFCPLFSTAGQYAVIGSWIIGNTAAGIGIREDASPITQNTSRFVPHYFV